jgi:POT family proton-dependent oligopeptide transporter
MTVPTVSGSTGKYGTDGNELQESERQDMIGKPRMLANLFSVELWERFSFYCM